MKSFASPTVAPAPRTAEAPEAAPWHRLAAELDAWGESGRTATFWWRDDDAGDVAPALTRLLDLSARRGVPVALAVIPARATWALAGRLAIAEVGVTMLQHGWSHANHATDGKQTELSDHRPLGDTLADLCRGRDVLSGMAGARFLPVMVPPWNRADPGVVAALPGLGFTAISGHGARPWRPAGPILVPAAVPQPVNIHLDPIDWHGTGGFRGEAAVIGETVAHLARRRTGQADPDEPTGLMTHHLNHDEAGWAFLDRFLAEIAAHPAASWLSGDHLFGAGPDRR